MYAPLAVSRGVVDVAVALGVETDDQAGRAQPFAKMINVKGQVETAGLFTTFDDHHATGVRNALLLQCANRRQRPEYGVPVVSAAPTVQFAVS